MSMRSLTPKTLPLMDGKRALANLAAVLGGAACILFLVRLVTAEPARRVAIYYTASIQGELSHCGCRDAKGGLARRAAALEKLRGSGVSVVVDLGDTFSAFFPGSPHARPAAVARADFLARAHRNLEIDLQVPGGRELALGVHRLAELFPPRVRPQLLAANLSKVASGEPAAHATEVITRGGRRLGFVGVTAALQAGKAAEFSVGDPHAAVRRGVRDLKSRAVDAVIVLSHLGYQGDRELAASVSGIDLIVGGKSQDMFRRPRLSAGIPIVQAGVRGKYLGQARLTWVKDQVFVEHDVLDLNADLPEHPGLAQDVQAFLQQHRVR